MSLVDRSAPPLCLATPLLFSYDLSLSCDSISVTFASTLRRFRTAIFAFSVRGFHFLYACLWLSVYLWACLTFMCPFVSFSFYFLLWFYRTRTFHFETFSFRFSRASFHKEFSPAVIQLAFYPPWLFPPFFIGHPPPHFFAHNIPAAIYASLANFPPGLLATCVPAEREAEDKDCLVSGSSNVPAGERLFLGNLQDGTGREKT